MQIINQIFNLVSYTTLIIFFIATVVTNQSISSIEMACYAIYILLISVLFSNTLINNYFYSKPYIILTNSVLFSFLCLSFGEYYAYAKLKMPVTEGLATITMDENIIQLICIAFSIISLFFCAQKIKRQSKENESIRQKKAEILANIDHLISTHSSWKGVINNKYKLSQLRKIGDDFEHAVKSGLLDKKASWTNILLMNKEKIDDWRVPVMVNAHNVLFAQIDGDFIHIPEKVSQEITKMHKEPVDI